VDVFGEPLDGPLGPEASMLDVSGGSKPRADGSHDFLIWAMPDELVRGDSIDIYFEPGTESNPKGTIFKFDRGAELETPRQFQSWPPLETELLEWEARPPVNSSISWSFMLNGAPPICVSPDSIRQHLGVHLLWNDERPERLRVNLSRSSIREICSRAGGEELLLQYVTSGSHVQVSIGA
jgi:hypothetical protein